MIDDYLIKAGLAKSRSQSTEFLARSQKGFDSVQPPYGDYIRDIWNAAKRLGIDSGPLFEMLIASVFIGANYLPFYQKAELALARKIESDFLFWDETKKAPICIELTSTLRERYKLADLQAFKVKANFPEAKFFQLTMDYKDAARRSSNDFESLDGLIFAGSEGVELLLSEIEKATLGKAAPLLENRNTTLHYEDDGGHANFQNVFSEG